LAKQRPLPFETKTASAGRLARGFLLQADAFMLPLSEKFDFWEKFSGSVTLMFQPKHLEDFGLGLLRSLPVNHH